MANAVPGRSGQVNESGDVKALFLKMFGGEVLTAFDTATKFKDKHKVRTITSGKSAQFPATWKVNASYHTPGTEITGQTTKQNERVITIDDLLLADVFIPNIDEAMSHYDYRSEYTSQCGIALAQQYDKHIAQVGLNAARAAATITGGNGGSALINAAYGSDSSVLAGGLWDAMQAMDEKDVPEFLEKNCFLKPALYYLLAQNTTVLNQDWGGRGSYADGKVLNVAGCNIVKTNNLPQANVTGSNNAAYDGDFSTTVGLIMTPDAVGTVKLLDLATETEYDMRRQGNLTIAKYAMGHGILRPECAVELKTA